MSDFGQSQPSRINWNASGEYGTVNYADESKMVVLFYTKSVEDTNKSAQAGRKICVDMAYVRMHAPGERLNVVDRPVQDNDKHRFPRQWANYVHNRTQAPEGTPIDLLFPNHPSVADNLRALGIYTIEQCAVLTANAIDTIGMGGQDYVNKANAYLKNSEKGQGFHQIQREMTELRNENRNLTKQIQIQKQQIDDLVQKMLDPSKAALQPSWQPGFDAQAARINANHPTKELAQSNKIAVKRQVEIDTDEKQTAAMVHEIQGVNLDDMNGLDDLKI